MLKSYHAGSPRKPADFVRIAVLDDEKRKKLIQVHYKSGEKHIQAERYKEARDDFTQVIALNEKYSGAFAYRGSAYLGLGQLNEAMTDLNHALEMDDKNIYAWAHRGVVHQKMGHYGKAWDDFTQALALDSSQTWIKDELKNIQIDEYYKSGEKHIQAERYKEARDDFTRVIALNEKYSGAFAYRGSAYLGLGQLNDALADLNHALEMDKDNIYALVYRIIVHQQMRQYEKALDDFTQMCARGYSLPYIKEALLTCQIPSYSPYYSSEHACVEQSIDDIYSMWPESCVIKTTMRGLSKLGINIKKDATEENIAKLVGYPIDPKRGGAWEYMISKALQHYGFEYIYISGKVVTINEIKCITENGGFIAVQVHKSGIGTHSLLIEGVSGHNVIFYDPYNDKKVRLPYQKLKKILTGRYTRPSEEQMKTRKPLLRTRVVEKLLKILNQGKKSEEYLDLDKTSIDNIIKESRKKLSRKDRIYIYAYYSDKLKCRIQQFVRDLKLSEHPEAKDFPGRYTEIEGKIKSALEEALKGKDSLLHRYATFSPAYHDKRETGERELITSIRSLETLFNECQKPGVVNQV